MTWISDTFKKTSEATKEIQDRFAVIVERHRPAMEKVLNDIREYVKEAKETMKRKR